METKEVHWTIQDQYGRTSIFDTTEDIEWVVDFAKGGRKKKLGKRGNRWKWRNTRNVSMCVKDSSMTVIHGSSGYTEIENGVSVNIPRYALKKGEYKITTDGIGNLMVSQSVKRLATRERVWMKIIVTVVPIINAVALLLSVVK